MKLRARRLLPVVLVLAIAALLLLLWRLRRHAATPPSSEGAQSTAAPVPGGTPTDVTFMVANDADGALLERRRVLALPEEPSARARFLLNQLIAGYAQPGSTHPIAANPGVDAVFLLPLPKPVDGTPAPQGTLAVVDLSGAFAQAHPSGIEPETLTLLSLISTLHANLADIAEVRFLVNGQPRDTLAGHADLSHTYLASSSAAPEPDTSGDPAGAGSEKGDSHP